MPASARLWALGRLLRISLFPTVAADVAVGLVLGGADRSWLSNSTPWVLIAAVLGVYHGALALNDWVDRAHDARTRPERPLPSGAIPAGLALLLALVLVGGGVALAWSVDPRAGRWTAALASCAVLYDLIGRGPLRGPALLGACRFGSLGLGLATAGWIGQDATPPLELFLLPLLYGAYVFFVSRLGRLEDEEQGAPLGLRPRTPLLAAATCLALVPGYAFLLGPADWPLFVSCLVAWGGASALFGLALGTASWTPPDVMRAMGACLRRLLVFTAAAVLLVPGRPLAGLLSAGFVLCGYPASFVLRRRFPPS